ncbi:DUF2325 domain-containing protein [Caballeronia sp. ATUFL_M2_KS44]|uniref:DUF2325 domain-containing protein n=1 Tax=Caballeronia sp. ATUFL_M2_KS44 TaxID=2921767 RepID=UPI002027949B|nr:DUF2325 domain-containing protein [Caballeronia sp. ATUFL_M2_KS44]
MTENPPFRLVRAPNPLVADLYGGHVKPHGDACCQPAKASPKALHRRVKLGELDSHLHCSIIGTCLGTNELRKLVPKFTDIDRYEASDLQIHHAAVELAIADGAGCKALQKALDQRYAGAIKRFDQARDPDAVLALWKEALKSGDIPPAYWALMTHPQSTIEVRQSAFGELHMLSHLVGAANRADIRRLVALEEENIALKDKVERQQSRINTMALERDAALREVAREALSNAAYPSDSELYREVIALKEKVDDCERRLALHASRRDAAEQRLLHEQQVSLGLRDRLRDIEALLHVTAAECDALERAMSEQSRESENDRHALDWTIGRKILYVGGRPGSNAVLKQLVASAGGELIVHDGGIEDRKGLLAAVLPRADLVVFPVDCIDHDSMNTLKRICDRHQISYCPLRTASVASFVESTAHGPARDQQCERP